MNAKAQKITIKLPWEILTIYSEVLPQDDEEDEDDIEAHEASVLRLKVGIDGLFATGMTLNSVSKFVGSGRRYEADDERGVSTLLRLPTSLIHIS